MTLSQLVGMYIDWVLDYDDNLYLEDVMEICKSNGYEYKEVAELGENMIKTLNIQ